jgi:hypothetical protein
MVNSAVGGKSLMVISKYLDTPSTVLWIKRRSYIELAKKKVLLPIYWDFRVYNRKQEQTLKMVTCIVNKQNVAASSNRAI